ncbi:MAG: proline racemase family protein [Thermomicrobiales bacterium]
MRIRQHVSTIDTHAAGEPLRIVTYGAPVLRGATVAERRAEMRDKHDWFRRFLLWEPRGHADMYGALLSPPVTPGADYAVLFMTNDGYSTMCGHGIVALTTALIETGQFVVTAEQTKIRYDTPAGLIEARAIIREGDVELVTFENVPAYRAIEDLAITLDDGSELIVDVVWGGAFYALVPASELGVRVAPENVEHLIKMGMDVKRAVMRATPIEHPLDTTLNGLYGTIITDEPSNDTLNGRNIVIFADGEVDRSPCGTGTSARLAALYADGEITLGEEYWHESVIGSEFIGRVTEETTFAGRPAVITEISGRGYITGFNQFVVDPRDPFREGFLLKRKGAGV